LFVHPGMQNSMPPDATKEIEHVKGLVARHFPVYDVRVNYDVVEFYCKIDETTLEDLFEKLRNEMAPQGYIPMVRYDKGEHVIVVGKKPKARYRSTYVNLAMLVITLLTVTFAGTVYWGSYADLPGDEVYSLENIATGIAVFTVPLLAIIGAHELAHYYAARRRNISASLPFFIPSIPPFGTFGAFISLRDPIPSRKSLLEVGIAGPLAGLIVAIPVGILGIVLTNSEARLVPHDFESGGSLTIALPLIYSWLLEIVPLQGDYLIHPTAFAAWVGFWVTAINLLPAGQLDGGHIARAVFGGYAKYAGWAAIAALIGLSFFFTAWMILAILILVLGVRHPPPLNDITKLDTKRKLAGVFAFVILILAFVPVPMWITEADHSFEMEIIGDTNATLAPGETYTLSFHLVSVGNLKSNVTIGALDPPAGWNIMVKPSSSGPTAYADTVTYTLNASEDAFFNASITASETAHPGNMTVVIGASALSDDGEVYFENLVQANITVTQPTLEFWTEGTTVYVTAGYDAITSIQVNNTSEGNVTIVLAATDLPPMVGAALFEDTLDANSTSTLNFTVPAQGTSTFSVLIFASSLATQGETAIYIQATYHSAVLATMVIPVVIE
jgi:Zn-dependent protease